jgi:hypothetical protein
MTNEDQDSFRRDAELTLFIMEGMERITDPGTRVEKSSIPGTYQRRAERDGLVYLETTAGRAQRYQSHVLVFKGGRTPIFAMDIVTIYDEDAMRKFGLLIPDVQSFVRNARTNGFTRTKKAIEAEKPFCLFDIPDYHEPVSLKNETRGILYYSETIDDSLDFYGGGEEAHFQPFQPGKITRTVVFRTLIQGCRLI